MERPRLIVQLDSLWNVMLKNDRFIASESFDFRYDLIVLDESESLLNHFDGGTMENKEIGIWGLFDEILKHNRKAVLLDGDISQRSLSFAESYGGMTYVRNDNTEQNKVFNLVLSEARWQRQPEEDIERFRGEGGHHKRGRTPRGRYVRGRRR